MTEQQDSGGQSNDTGFNSNADFYSLLNVNQSASVQQIAKRFREISRYIHPDKLESDQRDQFTELQKAYGYLSDPLTRTIYDEYGVPGLTVYEKNKSAFAEL